MKMKKRRWARGLLFSMIGILATAVFGTIVYTLRVGGASLPVAGQVTDFVAQNLDGQNVRFSSTTGKIRLITWFYTNCPDECPLTAYRMEQIQNILKKQKKFGNKVEFISVTFDPKRDTFPVLKNWAQRYHVDSYGWDVLRPLPSNTASILASWGVKTKSTDTEYIEHVLKTDLIDQDGNIRKVYNTADLNVNEVLSDINNLLSRESWG